MLDSFLNVAYAHEAREQMERDAVALLKQLPADDLLKIASGQKLAWLEPKASCGPDSGSFLDRFRGTPLFDEALALEQEELQAEMTNLERRKEQRASNQMQDGMWDLQDQLRIKKRLLELRLAAQDAGMGAQAGGGATPPLNSPVVPEASAQGAGAPGAESAPVEANKTAQTKLALAGGDVLKMKSLVSGNAPSHAAQAIKDRLKDAPAALGHVNKELGHFKSLSSTMRAAKKTAASKRSPDLEGERPSPGRGRAFLETVGDAAQSGAGIGAALGGIGGAAHGAAQPGNVTERVLRALGHGALGAGAGALALGGASGASVAPGAAVGSMTAHPALGAIGGAGAGYGLAELLGNPLLAPGFTAAGGAGGLVAGLRARHSVAQRDKFDKARQEKALAELNKQGQAPNDLFDGWGRELAHADFAKADEAITIEKAASEAGAVLAKEGAGMPGLGALGTMATNFIKNPANARTVMGAGAGALGGLASGLQKDEHGQRHILGGLAKGVAGGALGGLAGHAAQNIGTSLASGTGLAPAVKQYGAGWAQKFRDVASSMKPAVSAAPRAAMAPLQAAA